MYENQTFNEIMNRCLARVPADIDKREGSVIYDALAPAVVELVQMYINLGLIMDESFADTQSRDFLIRRAAERGITPTPATYALRLGVFNMDIPIGSRFSLGDLNYVAVQKISAGQYQMQCETAGEAGNRESGTLLPIDYIEGLTTAQLTAVLIPGEDEEDTEHLRQRYYDSLNAQAFGGNIKDYHDKTNAIEGVGGVKVYPVWNGGGTVRLIIVDSQFKKPSDTLIDTVQTIIDPEQNQGTGAGLAPIGHIVTVQGVGETAVDVGLHITFESEWTWDDVKPQAEAVIDEYLTELSSEWESAENTVVRISQIETRILDLPGVLDLANTTLNGVASNLALVPDNIPTRGAVTNG